MLPYIKRILSTDQTLTLLGLHLQPPAARLLLDSTISLRKNVATQISVVTMLHLKHSRATPFHTILSTVQRIHGLHGKIASELKGLMGELEKSTEAWIQELGDVKASMEAVVRACNVESKPVRLGWREAAVRYWPKMLGAYWVLWELLFRVEKEVRVALGLDLGEMMAKSHRLTGELQTGVVGDGEEKGRKASEEERLEKGVLSESMEELYIVATAKKSVVFCESVRVREIPRVVKLKEKDKLKSRNALVVSEKEGDEVSLLIDQDSEMFEEKEYQVKITTDKKCTAGKKYKKKKTHFNPEGEGEEKNMEQKDKESPEKTDKAKETKKDTMKGKKRGKKAEEKMDTEPQDMAMTERELDRTWAEVVARHANAPVPL